MSVYSPDTLSITAPNPAILYDRLWVSEVQPAPPGAVHYQSGAILPVKFRSATPAEKDAYIISPDAAGSQTAWLLPRNAILSAYIEAILPYNLSHTTSPPGQLTTTSDRDDPQQRLVGLHVDSKANYPLATREQSPLRLGFNYGPGARFLLLGNISVMAMARELGHTNPDHIPTCGTVRTYLSESRPSFQVAWLLLKRYDAYIASTESLPHDGSTYFKDALQSTIFFWYDEHALLAPRV